MNDVAIGASERLAAHVAGVRYDALPPPVIHAFKRALLDHVACAIAGSSMPVSRALLSYFEETDASRTAMVVGTGTKLSAANAALVNGANTHERTRSQALREPARCADERAGWCCACYGRG